MSEAAARQWAMDWLRKKGYDAEFEICGVESRGAVFVAFWAPKSGAEVAGNAPLLIDLPRKFITSTGTAYPLEYYLQNYAITGDPQVEPIKKIRLKSIAWDGNRAEAITALKNATTLTLAEAKAAIDSVLAGQSILVSAKDPADIEVVVARLRDSGFDAEVELCPPAKT
jgi:ribosomal protein L7/L12